MFSAGGNAQKDQRRKGIAHRLEIGGEEIVQENRRDAPEHDIEIIARELENLRGRIQPAHNGVHAQQGHGRERRRHRQRQHEGIAHAGFERCLVLAAKAGGKHHAAAHAQAQQDGSEECHQREGRADARQRARAHKPADYPRIHHIVRLLQNIAQQHGQCEKRHGGKYLALRQIFLHSFILQIFLSLKVDTPAICINQPKNR